MADTQSKLISICIPTYNRVNYLEETLRSILPQVGPEIELWVSDNCSTDGTKEMIERYQQTYPVIRYSRNDTNLGFDRNLLRCLELASGEYVWFFGSDDVLCEGAVDAVRQRIRGAHSRPTLVYLNYDITDNAGKLLVASKIDCQRDREFTRARECLEELGLNLGFMSALVLRRERCLGVASTAEFIGSEWIHLHLVLCCLFAGGTTQYVGQPSLRARRSLSFDNDLTQVFVEKVDHILWDAHRRGYPWLTIFRAMNHTVREYYARFVLAWRCDAPEVLRRSFPVMLRIGWKYPWFWMLIVPLRFTPRRLAVALRNEVRSFRAWRNARLLRQLEKSTRSSGDSRNPSVPARAVVNGRRGL